MKKRGFTLAEILIALTIVGVIAAITIPTLATENKKKVWANSLSSAVSNIENAMTTYLVTEGEYSLSDTKAWKEYSTDLGNDKALGKKFGLKKKAELADSYYEKVYPINPNKEAITLSSIGIKGAAYETNSDITYFIETEDGEEKNLILDGCRLEKRVATIGIDVNGKKGPNRIGRDIFAYVLGSDGYLFPYGSTDLNLYDNTAEENDTNCSVSSSSHGLQCSGRLANNGYKMDY